MAQKKLNKQPWNREKVLKKTAKHSIFIVISALIMHTFMAYLVGLEEMWEIIGHGPAKRSGDFVVMIVLTGLFYGVFSKMREQVCTTICPYGRLQGVLLDRQSVVVAYDHERGETRSKLRKNEDREAQGKGDCIDCNQCASVCPTGIDIRNGTQLECVNCTACIDACDSIMDLIGKPRGLVRYASEQNIADKKPFRFTARMRAHSTVLIILIGILISLLIIRSDVGTTILRTPGMMYQKREDGTITNLYQLKMVNRTNISMPIRLELMEPQGTIQSIGGQAITLEKQGIAEGVFFVIIDPKELIKMSTRIKIGVFSGDKLVEKVSTKFLGPVK